MFCICREGRRYIRTIRISKVSKMIGICQTRISTGRLVGRHASELNVRATSSAPLLRPPWRAERRACAARRESRIYRTAHRGVRSTRRREFLAAVPDGQRVCLSRVTLSHRVGTVGKRTKRPASLCQLLSPRRRKRPALAVGRSLLPPRHRSPRSARVRPISRRVF